MSLVKEEKQQLTAVLNCNVHDLVILGGHYYRVAWFDWWDSWKCYLHVSREHLRYDGPYARPVAPCNVLIDMDMEVDRRQFRP